ncbi:MAG: BON domain-containing protein [Thiotrichales bacterium]|nr:BON domain-containing protein [Thiotrichales bacterium]
MKKNPIVFRLCILLSIFACLHGCAAVAVGGGAAAVSVAVDRRTTGTVVEDEAIELKARRMIFENREINDKSHINVTSYNTRVLLTGETPEETLKKQIVDMIRGLDKVTHVYNEINIAAPSSLLSRSSDGVITSKLKAKMLAADNLPGVAIKVVTESGVVYLMGLVSRAEADKATDVARQTGGVQKVVRLFEYTD